MARTVRDAALETRTARGKLASSGQPYYRTLEPGLLHLGYRKPRSGAGKWLARVYVGNGAYRLHKIGVTDDLADADNKLFFSFKQAQEYARKILREQAGGGVGTVADAVAAYLKYLEDENRSAASVKNVRHTLEAHVIPELGDIELAKLTSETLKDWFIALSRKPARVRTRKGQPPRHRTRSDNPDHKRARRVSANRARASLVAALNHAFIAGHIGSDLAWRRVRPFKGVDVAKVRYLSIVESKRLINAASPEFRPLLQAAFLTGARYGGLAQLTVSDFNPDANTLRLRTRKGDGSERVFHVHLTDEAQEFFCTICAGKRSSDLILAHTDGRPWGKSHQDDQMEEASRRAGISPAANFHVTRHTFASHAIMNGAPLMVVAAALGHVDTRMVEKHYGHLSPSYAADAIRKAAPRFGIKPGNVRPLRP
jgi:integrase